MAGYDIYETDRYIQVQPKGQVINARACRTFYKCEGWDMASVKAFYEE